MRKLILFFILLILVYGCAQTTNEMGYKDITSEELKTLMEEKEVFLVDVHIPEQEHIKGTDAVIPFNEIDQNLDKLPKDKNVIIAVYCRSGSMSIEASETLVNLGYKNVYNQLDGIKDWKLKGFEFE